MQIPGQAWAWGTGIVGSVLASLLYLHITRDLDESARLVKVEADVAHLKVQVTRLVDLIISLLQGAGVQ